MVTRTNTRTNKPAPWKPAYKWTCGFCGAGPHGQCGDVRGQCRGIWGTPTRPFVPPEANVTGEWPCACYLAGHHKILAVIYPAPWELGGFLNGKWNVC